MSIHNLPSSRSLHPLRFLKLSVSLLALVSFSSFVTAAPIVTWDFATDTSPTVSTANLAASDMTKGAGISMTNGAGRSSTGEDLFVRTNTGFNGPVVTAGDYTDADNEASVLAVDDYFQFTVTVDDGFQLDITSVSYDYTAVDVEVNKGPVAFFKSFLRSDVDSYTETLTSYTFTDVAGTIAADTGSSGPNNVVATLDSNYDALTGTTIFRLYMNDGVNAGSEKLLHRFDNIVIDGTVTPVPEPASYAVAFGLVAVLLLVLQRRKRS